MAVRCRTPKRLALALLLGLLVTPAFEAVAADESPVVLAKIFFKVASYDGNLPAGPLKIAVVYPRASAGQGAAVLGAFASMPTLTINGRGFVVVDAPYSNPGDLDALVRDGIYGVFVVSGAPAPMLQHLRTLAAKHRLFTFAQEPKDVEGGMTAAVQIAEGKRAIVLNATAALEQGRKFEPAFLDVCKVIR